MEWTAEQINEHIDKFLSIDSNPPPLKARITVWCESNNLDDSGFAYDVTIEGMGLEIFIAKSWILQSELDKLCEEKIKINNENN